MSKKHTNKSGDKAADGAATPKTTAAKSAKNTPSPKAADAPEAEAPNPREQAEKFRNGSGKNAAEAAGPKTAAAKSAQQAESSDNDAEAAATEALSPQEQAELKAAEQFDHSFLKAVSAMENLRRRHEKDVNDAYKFVLSDFALAIGEVRDCLETAINDAGEVEKLREGVSLTLRKLVSAMDARHILPIRPDVGAVFDPAIHMAIGMLPPTAQAPEKTVAAIVQAGYMLNGRVIRPADVMVSRQADEKTDKSADKSEADAKQEKSSAK